ncbi:hypothetical protein LSTR_LSTR003599 [Laodelphax striatellus]|uniref:RING-type E3 ubiquitin transferase n=1 Tax=Laodelphax striatellus TaxID=195883 RepID=A0A482WKZ5_LAOST|nr:hypothetical protein LSTR_LSTR003599 [Laodelphax striatellus]
MPASIHPAFLAIAAVIGIGYAIYSIFSEDNQERPHSDNCRPRTPPPRRSEQYDTHPNRLRGRRRVDTDSTSNCSICLENLAIRRNLQLPCTHSFHAHCLEEWINRNRVCPQCREVIPWGIRL